MKIALKTNFNQLTEIIKILQENIVEATPETLAQKANKYLFENIFKKLLKKQIDKHEARKEFKITMPYAEAFVLWQHLQTATINDDYRKAVWFRVTGEIHQKLQSS